MRPMVLSIPLILVILNSLLFTATATLLNNNRIRTNCTGATYAANSIYETNLNTLLSSLESKSSFSNYNTSVTGTGPNRVYGLYVCEGDLATADCQTCIQTATSNITADGSCPSFTQAIIWYDYCMVRYSNTNFFGVMDSNGFSMTNPERSQVVTSPVPYQMVSSLVQVTPLRRPMFATNASTSTNANGLAQCTGDLNSTSCSQCLNTILGNIKSCCTGSNGWRYLSASCWVRYESTPFLRDLRYEIIPFLRDLNGNFTQMVVSACSADSLPTSNSLKTLLLDITTKAAPTGFYNNSLSQLSALALCRAYIASNDCSSCLTQASNKLTTDLCPNNTEGTVWYEKCMIRYSNQRFFGVVDNNGRSFCGVNQVSTESGSSAVTFVAALVGVAAKSTLLFAANETGVGGSQPGYGLVQCSRDLSSEGCNKCLQKGMSVVSRDCKLTDGWRYLSGSCTIRYEITPFFNTSVIQIGAPAPHLALEPPPPNAVGGGNNKSSKTVAVILGPILGLVLLGPLLYLTWWILKRKNAKRTAKLGGSKPFGQPSNMNFVGNPLMRQANMDIPFVDLAILEAATNNFSNANKLGEGGFGPVYKGTLEGGQEIAIKRLSAKSKQGVSEFKNEMKLIAKLQHRNLVRVLGCCVEREEKLLIYEYLPNKSLDAFLFDEDKRAQLDWTKRRLIIVGIARGLLYLHEDSVLKVIHRDLKASNVLLDSKMNPKISDFGMSKIFETGEAEANTGRIVGTLGYMAPEYAMDGIFSEKSDVYSFGVLLLEIISGQKNGRSHFEQHGQTLLRRAWELWSEDRAMVLVDELLGDSYPPTEMKRVIHIGLLCIQETVEKRPTVSSVVLMLRSEQMVLPEMTQPPTFFRERVLEKDLRSSTTTTSSIKGYTINEVTNTDVTAR